MYNELEQFAPVSNEGIETSSALTTAALEAMEEFRQLVRAEKSINSQFPLPSLSLVETGTAALKAVDKAAADFIGPPQPTPFDIEKFFRPILNNVMETSSEALQCWSVEANTEANRPESAEEPEQNGLSEDQRAFLVNYFRKAFSADASQDDRLAFLVVLGALNDQGGPEAVEKFIKDINAGLPPGWKLECRPLPADSAAQYDAAAAQKGFGQRTYSVQTVLTYNGTQVGQNMNFVRYKK